MGGKSVVLGINFASPITNLSTELHIKPSNIHIAPPSPSIKHHTYVTLYHRHPQPLQLPNPSAHFTPSPDQNLGTRPLPIPNQPAPVPTPRAFYKGCLDPSHLTLPPPRIPHGLLVKAVRAPAISS